MADQDDINKVLAHWHGLSNVHKKTLHALSKEVVMASELIETSVDGLSERFLELASLSQKQQRKIDSANIDVEGTKEAKKTLKEASEHSVEISAMITDIVTGLQFQDRTSQRLSHISSTINVMADMLSEMDAQAMAMMKSEYSSKENKEWLEKMISDMQLGEMRERFVKHAMFDDSETLFSESNSEDKTVEHSEASDDIELF